MLRLSSFAESFERLRDKMFGPRILSEPVEYKGSPSDPWNLVPLGTDEKGATKVWDIKETPNALFCGPDDEGRVMLERAVLTHVTQHDEINLYCVDGCSRFVGWKGKHNILGIAESINESIDVVESVVDIMCERCPDIEDNERSGNPEKSEPDILLLVSDIQNFFATQTETSAETRATKAIFDAILFLIKVGKSANIHVVVSSSGAESECDRKAINSIGCRLLIGGDSLLFSKIFKEEQDQSKCPFSYIGGSGYMSDVFKDRASHEEPSRIIAYIVPEQQKNPEEDTPEKVSPSDEEKVTSNFDLSKWDMRSNPILNVVANDDEKDQAVQSVLQELRRRQVLIRRPGANVLSVGNVVADAREARTKTKTVAVINIRKGEDVTALAEAVRNDDVGLITVSSNVVDAKCGAVNIRI